MTTTEAHPSSSRAGFVVVGRVAKERRVEGGEGHRDTGNVGYTEQEVTP